MYSWDTLYLQTENQVLKEELTKSGRKLRLNDGQRRRLAQKGKALGREGLQKYASLFTPETILRWHRRLIAWKFTAKRKIDTERAERRLLITELCVKFAEENPGWGYERIQGALANLGYHVSKTTVGNILRRAGLCPSPDRTGKSSWRQFLRAHLVTTCVADFLTTEVWTMGGLVRYHVLFVMNLAKREVQIAQINCKTNGQVMAQVARNLTDAEDGFLRGIDYFVCDRDALFTQEFRGTLKEAGVTVVQCRPQTPKQNAFAERFVKSLKTECLDKLIFLGEVSLKKAVGEYVKHYHHERDHQSLDNLIPFPQTPRREGENGLVAKSERLGGLLNYY